MKSELLSIDTAAKLVRYDKAIKYIKEIIANGEKEFVEEWDEDTKGYILSRIYMCKEILDVLEGNNENQIAKSRRCS